MNNYFKDYFMPKEFQRQLLTVEMVRIIREHELNRICEECKKPLWSCYCFTEGVDQ